jgi:hypothetical protein
MPHEEAELNMRLFAERVMPVLQRDRAFSGSAAGMGEGVAGSLVTGADDVFAPA